MIAKHILCPIDFSDSSEIALDYASALAKEAGALLHIVYVDDSQVIYDVGLTGYVGMPEDTTQIEQQLATKTPTKSGVPCLHEVLFGFPADALIQYARKNHVDMIVMGTHGRTGISRLLMGSTAEAVVRGADCPVLTIKQPVPVRS